MFGNVIVPLDGSAEAARALGPGSAIARYLNVTLEVVGYHPPTNDGHDLRAEIDRQVGDIGGVSRSTTVLPADAPIGQLLAELLASRPACLAVMSTHGRGRSAAILGSVANDVVRDGRTPVVLLGPQLAPHCMRLHGPLVVAVDDNDSSEAIVPLAEAFIAAFDYEPHIVSINSDAAVSVADKVAVGLGRPVSSATIDASSPAAGVLGWARANDASLIALATRAEKGLDRLAHGSVAAEIVAHADCPVLAFHR